MCDAMDIDEDCTTVDLTCKAASSPVSSVTKSFQRLSIRDDTAPVRDRRRRTRVRKEAAAAVRKRKQKPTPRIPRQNPERRLHTRHWGLQLVPRLVRHDVTAFFATHFEEALDTWISILTQTTIPGNVASSDPCVIHAFRLLDNARGSGDPVRSRLAYIRLTQVFEAVEKNVARNRQHGRLPAEKRTRGYRNACIAVDIYIDAQEQAGTSRADVKEYRRIARRWRILSGPSPLFIIIYTDAAEGLAYVQHRYTGGLH